MAADGELEVSAELLRRGAEIPAMVARLAERFESALPEHVTVERSTFRRRVTGLTVRLDDEHFRIELASHDADAWIDHVVRGVCLKSEEVDVEPWLERLAGALKDEATRNTTVRLALEQALST